MDKLLREERKEKEEIKDIPLEIIKIKKEIRDLKECSHSPITIYVLIIVLKLIGYLPMIFLNINAIIIIEVISWVLIICFIASEYGIGNVLNKGISKGNKEKKEKQLGELGDREILIGICILIGIIITVVLFSI